MIYKLFFKRLFDVVISAILIFLLFVPFIFIALLIVLDSGRPVFYMSPRIGKGFRKFNMIKFRTMVSGSPVLFNDDGSTYNSSEDSRVTKVGKVLREFSLDEIPQLFNVLVGDMSLIGPRASLYSVKDSFRDDEVDKMTVRPGITGYTQAYYRNGLGNREKRLYDAQYSRNVNFISDMKIVFKTIETVIKRDNLYTKK